jgi:hypothetical protein
VPAPGAVAVMPGPGIGYAKTIQGTQTTRVGVRIRARVRVRDEHLGFTGYLGRCWGCLRLGRAPEAGIRVGYRVRKAATGYAGHVAGRHAAAPATRCRCWGRCLGAGYRVRKKGIGYAKRV